MLKAKKNNKDLLYFKADSHITDAGMFFIYKTIINTINYNSKYNLKIIEPTEVFYNKFIDIGTSSKPSSKGNVNIMSMNSKKYLDYYYKYYLVQSS